MSTNNQQYKLTDRMYDIDFITDGVFNHTNKDDSDELCISMQRYIDISGDNSSNLRYVIEFEYINEDQKLFITVYIQDKSMAEDLETDCFLDGDYLSFDFLITSDEDINKGYDKFVKRIMEEFNVKYEDIVHV